MKYAHIGIYYLHFNFLPVKKKYAYPPLFATNINGQSYSFFNNLDRTTILYHLHAYYRDHIQT